jgi:hypothetical protein
MEITPKSLKAIEKFRAERKFEAVSLYPGAPDEEIRLGARRL